MNLKKITHLYPFILTPLITLTACQNGYSEASPTKKTSTFSLLTPSLTKTSTSSISSNLMQSLKGEWKTVLDNGTDLTFIFSITNDSLYLSSNSRGFSGYKVNNVLIKDQTLSFPLPYLTDYEIYTLTLQPNGSLIGSVQYNNQTQNFDLTKCSTITSIPSFETTEFSTSYKERIDILRSLGDYESDNIDFTLTYKTDEYEKYADFIQTYGLDELLAGKEDIELMQSLLDWVCENCNHSSYGYPDNGDVSPASLMAYFTETGGLNCRSLSLLLSQLMQAYGIPARPVTCLPVEALFPECHVVVEAYSSTLDKWVMLDPTNHLMLKDSSGTYINVLELRHSLINELSLVASENASYNEGTFNLNDYKGYMAKNLCSLLFNSLNAYGSDSRSKDTPSVILIPSGYDQARYTDYSSITTNPSKIYRNPFVK